MLRVLLTFFSAGSSTVSASLLRAFRICEAATLVDVFSKAYMDECVSEIVHCPSNIFSDCVAFPELVMEKLLAVGVGMRVEQRRPSSSQQLFEQCCVEALAKRIMQQIRRNQRATTRLPLQLQHRMNKGPTYHVGLRLAVVALRVEAALILASGRGRLKVRRNCARGHDVFVWGRGKR